MKSLNYDFLVFGFDGGGWEELVGCLMLISW